MPSDDSARRAGSRTNRERFFADLASDYAALKGDRVAWEAERAEEEAWAASVDEGLDED